MKVWLNGALIEERHASVSIADKGLLVGDGVFETMRSYAGKTFAFEAHLARLATGAHALAITVPDPDVLPAAVESVLRANGLADARVRITVTSGVGPVGLDRGGGRPTVLVTATPLPLWPATATAVVSPWPRNERSVLVGVKTTSNAENVAKLAHARRLGADEALSLNLAGNLCEGTTSNVFVVSDGQVATPPLSSGCLAGITREYMLRWAPRFGIALSEQDVPGAAIAQADELFLTSSTRELQPLVQVDESIVGTGKPGPLTRRFAASLSESIRCELGL